MSKRRRLADIHSVPRVRVHKDGRATLSGLSYEDLRSILTSASLNAYDSEKKAKKEKDPEQRAEEEAYARHIIALTDIAHKSLCPEWLPPTPKTKAERLAVVTKARKERLLIESIVDEVIAARHSDKPLKPLLRLLEGIE